MERTESVYIQFEHEEAFDMPAVQKTYKTLAREFHGMKFSELEDRRDRLAGKIKATEITLDFSNPMDAHEEPNPVLKGVLRNLKKVLMELHVREERLVRKLMRYRDQHPTIKQLVHE